MTDSAFELDLQRLFAEEGFVRRLARGLLFDEHAVDDVVQQTWMAALRTPPSDRAAARGWLATVVRRIVHNRTRTEVRRRRREADAEVDTPVAGPSVDEVLQREERRREVVEVLDALPEPYRTTVALRYLEGLEPTEIARRRGTPAATVRTHVRRGLEQMRQRLDERHGDRLAWCTALLPIARGRDAALAGVAGAGATTAVLLPKLLAAALVLVTALLTWSVWPDPATQPPTTAIDTANLTAAAARDDLTAVSVANERSAPSTPVSPVQDPASLPPGNVGGLRARLLAPDGEPLAGARIEAFALDGLRLFGGDTFLPEAEARTDDDGTFVLRGLPMQSRCVMLADADGDLRQLVPLPVSPAPGRVQDAGDVRLEARAVLTGTVVDEQGEPVAGAEVFSADVPGLVLAAFPIDRFAPEHGVLLMVPRPDPEAEDGWYGQLRPHLAWRITETDYGDLPNDTFCPVVLEGTPLQRLLDRLPFARATTASDGTFRLGGVAAGANVLVARTPGSTPAVRSNLMVRGDDERDVGELELTEGRVLTGRVLDHDGNPVEGAPVRAAQLALLGFRGVAPCQPEVRTDADGRFSIAGLSRGKAVLAFRGDDRSPWRAIGPVATDDELELVIEAPVRVPLRLELPADATADDVQLLARPAPPLGEMTRLGMCERFAPVEFARGEHGELSVELAPGVWSLRCTLPGMRAAARTVVAPSPEPIAFVLRRDARLEVTVLDARGEPAADAELFVQAQGDPDQESAMLTTFGLPRFTGSWPMARHRTDARGRANVTVPRGDVRLSAQAGARGAAVLQVDARGDDTATLRLRETGGIYGQLDVGPSMGGDPTAYRIVVRCYDTAQIAPTDPSTTVRPAIDGSFRTGDLPPGSYRVLLCEPMPRSLSFASAITWLDAHSSPFYSPDDIEAQNVQVVAGTDVEVRFAVGGLNRHQGGVTGTVTIDGQPAEGWTIWRRHRTREGGTTTDAGFEDRARATIGADGTFVVDDLEPGRHWLGVCDDGGAHPAHVFEVVVEAAVRTTVRADVRTGRVTGNVRGSDGTPAAGVRVGLLEREHDIVNLTTTTDAAGDFVLTDVPTGDYYVYLHADHLRADRKRLTVLAGNATPPVFVAGTPVWKLTMQLSPAVVVPDGQNVTYCISPNGTDGWHSIGTPQRSATFSLSKQCEHTMRVRVDGIYYHTDPATVTVDPSDLTPTVSVGIGAKVER